MNSSDRTHMDRTNYRIRNVALNMSQISLHIHNYSLDYNHKKGCSLKDQIYIEMGCTSEISM